MNVRLLAIGFSVVFALPAAAQDIGTPLSPLFECRQIDDSAARLACLDAAVDTLYEAANSGEVAVVSRNDVEAAEEATYGLNIPDFRLPSVRMPQLFNSGSTDIAEAANTTTGTSGGSEGTTRVVERNDQGQITRIEGLPVQSIDRDRQNRMIITLQNGQIWRQTDDTRIYFSRRAVVEDMIVHVRSGALGSHFMQLNDQGRWFRARRER
ncbi:hypothetical protein [Hyphobacterium sp.]|uniref:hypothetical protein n=1 Tax=Hyphobacterium sp. TaxID=2004662 RepID=UPI003BAC5D42